MGQKRPIESQPLVRPESVFFKGSISDSEVQPGVKATDGPWKYIIINDN